MRPNLHRRSNERGTILITAMIMGGVLAFSVLAMFSMSSFRARSEMGRWEWQQAYYHAENVLNWMAQTIADSTNTGPAAPFVTQYSLAAGSSGTVPIPYLTSLAADSSSGFRNAWVTTTAHPSGVSNVYQVTVSVQVKNKVRTLQASVVKNPPSLVFDYEYFLNNWGWWWGSSITGNGDNRANWDFDFRYSPTVNGSVIANGEIASDGVAVNPFAGATPFGGLAAADPVARVHSGTPRLTMPNLMNLDTYKAKAQAAQGKLYVGATLKVDAVHTDAAKPGIYLEGTAANPIKIQGPVVIPGDVIIKGPITGIGTLYVGGNLYVANDVTYANGPDFSTPPATMPQAQTDNWVASARSAQKDLVGFAVRGAVFGGDVNSTDFQTWCYSASGWGLAGLGSEANLGADGIRGTPDDGIAYAHPFGGSTVNNAAFDADEDGTIDGNYNLATDILMTSTRAATISGYPEALGVPVLYSTLATCNYNRMDGIYYSNHAVACRMSRNSQAVWNGAIICRDEAIVFNNSLKFNYDPRVHSRFSDDPNRVIDLGLPVASKVRVQDMDEIEPRAGFYSSL